jgi:hypothetical protein
LSKNRKRRGKKRGRSADANGVVSMEELMLAKDFVQSLGPERAKEALAAYARLGDWGSRPDA